MRSRRTTKLTRLLLALGAAALALPSVAVAREGSSATPRLGLSFEPNVGQFEPDVRFLARGLGYNLTLRDGGASLEFVGRTDAAKLGVRLLGGATREPVGVQQQTSRFNYLVGPDSRRWKTNVQSFARATYVEVLPGIDWLFYGHSQRELEYDFLVKPGARVGDIRVQFEGARRIHVERGRLQLQLQSGGKVEQSPPVAYQLDAQGRRELVPARYQLHTDQSVGFAIGAYDAARPLIIDPQLSYATYYGGSGFEDGRAVSIDSAGSVFLAGSTSLGLFPIVDALQPTYGGGSTDAFVCKLNLAGNAVEFATFIGGDDADVATGIALDTAGNAYVAGYTLSTNFPTVGGLQSTSAGLTDAFVVKLNAIGSVLVYATYLGGAADDYAHGIAVSGGSARVAGTTSSANFPTALATQSTFGGASDAFVSYLNGAGSALSFSTFLGGSATEVANGIAVDASGAAYVVGATSSNNLPTVSPFQASYAGGGFDAFVAKLGAVSGAAYVSYLGGSGRDEATSVAVDNNGAAHVAGLTASTGLPGAATGVQPARAGATDAVVSKIADGGASIVGSTYLGGSGNDRALAVAVDPRGSIFLTGYTDSVDFPTLLPNQAAIGGGNDVFLAKLSSIGEMSYATYFGGASNDRGSAIASDAAGAVALVGITTSSNFPTQPGALYAARVGSQDAFVIKIPPPSATPAPAAGWWLYGAIALALAAVIIVMSRRAQIAV